MLQQIKLQHFKSNQTCRMSSNHQKLRKWYKKSYKIHSLVSSNGFNNFFAVTIKYQFSDKTYKKESAPIWSKEISDDINKQLAEQSSLKYKYVVTTVISEKLGQGCRLICRTRWDSESDRKSNNKYHSIPHILICLFSITGQVSESFTNESLFCICTVFAIFLYWATN